MELQHELLQTSKLDLYRLVRTICQMLRANGFEPKTPLKDLELDEFSRRVRVMQHDWIAETVTALQAGGHGHGSRKGSARQRAAAAHRRAEKRAARRAKELRAAQKQARKMAKALARAARLARASAAAAKKKDTAAAAAAARRKKKKGRARPGSDSDGEDDAAESDDDDKGHRHSGDEDSEHERDGLSDSDDQSDDDSDGLSDDEDEDDEEDEDEDEEDEDGEEDEAEDGESRQTTTSHRETKSSVAPSASGLRAKGTSVQASVEQKSGTGASVGTGSKKKKAADLSRLLSLERRLTFVAVPRPAQHSPAQNHVRSWSEIAAAPAIPTSAQQPQPSPQPSAQLSAQPSAQPQAQTQAQAQAQVQTQVQSQTSVQAQARVEEQARGEGQKQSNDLVVVAFVREGMTGVQCVWELQWMLEHQYPEATQLVVVSRHGLTPKAQLELKLHLGATHRVRTPVYADLLANVTEHVMVRQHRRLTAEEHQALVLKYRLWPGAPSSRLPTVRTEDPIAVYSDLRCGDIVALEQPGLPTTYRVVEDV